MLALVLTFNHIACMMLATDLLIASLGKLHGDHVEGARAKFYT